jgi:S-adenosylhomocysteine hydrolase
MEALADPSGRAAVVDGFSHAGRGRASSVRRAGIRRVRHGADAVSCSEAIAKQRLTYVCAAAVLLVAILAGACLAIR